MRKLLVIKLANPKNLPKKTLKKKENIRNIRERNGITS